MSSSVTTSSTTTPAYAKRKLQNWFRSIVNADIIHKAILNLSKMLLKSDQNINVHRSGYNNNSDSNNPHNHSSNQTICKTSML